jgi:hypothetical protein
LAHENNVPTQTIPSNPNMEVDQIVGNNSYVKRAHEGKCLLQRWIGAKRHMKFVFCEA